MSANPHANGGLLRKDLKLPDFRKYAVDVPTRGTTQYENTKPLGEFLRDVMKNNPTSFRVFGPDETASNRLQAVYEASKKTWMADMLPEDADGGELSPRRPRHGDAVGAHAARLAGGVPAHRAARASSTPTRRSRTSSIRCSTSTPSGWTSSKNHVPWRAPVASENILLSSTVWRQDHNGFSHQDPGFIDLVTNKGPSVTRVYLPPDANTLLSVADHCLRSTDYINVIVADKQKHLQFTTIDEAIAPLHQGPRHLAAGEHRCGRGAGRRAGVLRRRGDDGGAGGGRHPARAGAGSEAALRQRRGSVQAAAGVRASRTDRPSASSTACSPRTSRSSSTSTAIRGSSTSSRTASRATRTCTCAATRKRATSTRRSSWRC